MSNLFEDSGASFSPDRKYRYELHRIWDTSKPIVMFIGLNPSTANEERTDPTITRVRHFAKTWGQGGFYMMNLFGLVSTDPDVVIGHEDPVGNNDRWLQTISDRCEHVIFAWGNFKIAEERAEQVIKMFPEALCLIKNKNGTPRHPLYIPGNIQPIKFRIITTFEMEMNARDY